MKLGFRFCKLYYAGMLTFLIFLPLKVMAHDLNPANLNLIFINWFIFSMVYDNRPIHLVFVVIMRKLYSLIFKFF